MVQIFGNERPRDNDRRRRAEQYREDESELERADLAKDKTGVFTGAYARNPLFAADDPKGRVPIWIADYVIVSYGTGAIMAVPQGQVEGGKALGLHLGQIMLLIVLPQAFRLAIAPTIGFMVQIIKGTSLAYIIGFHDLMAIGRRWANAPVPGTQPFLIYPLMAMIYFALCFPLSVWSRRLEKRLGSPKTKGGASAAA